MKITPIEKALNLLKARHVEEDRYVFLSDLSPVELMVNEQQLGQLEMALNKVKPEEYQTVREAWISGLNWKTPPLYALELTAKDAKGTPIAPGFFREYLETTEKGKEFVRYILTTPKYPAPLLIGPNRHTQYLTYTVIRDDYIKRSAGKAFLMASRPNSVEEMRLLERELSLKCNTWEDFLMAIDQAGGS